MTALLQRSYDIHTALHAATDPIDQEWHSATIKTGTGFIQHYYNMNITLLNSNRPSQPLLLHMLVVNPDNARVMLSRSQGISLSLLLSPSLPASPCRGHHAKHCTLVVTWKAVASQPGCFRGVIEEMGRLEFSVSWEQKTPFNCLITEEVNRCISEQMTLNCLM